MSHFKPQTSYIASQEALTDKIRIFVSIFAFLALSLLATPALSAPLAAHHGASCTALLTKPLSLIKKSQEPDQSWRLDTSMAENTYPLKPEYVGEDKGESPLWKELGEPHKVNYFSPEEAKSYQVKIADGYFVDLYGNPICPGAGCSGNIVIDEEGRIYFNTRPKRLRLHHSSFTSGRPVLFAGEAVIKGGRLSLISTNSGHYRPDLKSLKFIIETFHAYGITDFKLEVPGSKSTRQFNYDSYYFTDEDLLNHFKKYPEIMNQRHALTPKDLNLLFNEESD